MPDAEPTAIAGVGVTLAARLLAMQEETRSRLTELMMTHGAHGNAAVMVAQTDVEQAMTRAIERAKAGGTNLEEATAEELAAAIKARE